MATYKTYRTYKGGNKKYKLNDLFSFAKTEMGFYRRTGVAKFKEKAKRFYDEYKKRGGTRKLS